MEEFQIGDGNDQCGEGRDGPGLAKEKTLQLQSGDQQSSSSVNIVKSPQVACDGNGSFKAEDDNVNMIETIILKDINITHASVSEENFQLNDVMDSDSLNRNAEMLTDVHCTELHNKDSVGSASSQCNVGQSVEELRTNFQENISSYSGNTSFRNPKGLKRRHSQDDIFIYSCDSSTRLYSPESNAFDTSESFIEIRKHREDEVSQQGSRMDLSDEENTIIYLSDSVKGHFNQHDKLDDFSILSCHPRIETIEPCDSTEDIPSRIISRRPCTKISDSSTVTTVPRNSDKIFNNICRSNEEHMDIEVYSESVEYRCDKDPVISNSEEIMDIEPDTFSVTESYKETIGNSVKEKLICSEPATISVPSNQENKSNRSKPNSICNGRRNSASQTNDDTEQIIIEEIDFQREIYSSSLPDRSSQKSCNEGNVISNSKTSDEKQDHVGNFFFDNEGTGKLLDEEKNFSLTDISITEQDDELEKKDIVTEQTSKEDLRTSEPIRIKYNVKSGTFEVDDSVMSSYDEEASYVPPTNSSMIPEDGSVSQLDSCEDLAEDDRPNTPDSVQVIDNKRCLRSKSSLIRPSSEGSKTTIPNGMVRKTRSHGNINSYLNDLHGSENTNADVYLINQPNTSDTTLNGDETIVQCTEPCTESESSIPDNESVKPISLPSGDDSCSGSGKIDATSDVQRQDSTILSTDSTVKGSIIEPSNYDVIGLLMKLRPEDSFSVAMEVIIACLEHVRLTQPNAKIFYGMMSSVYTYIQNIIGKDTKVLGTQKSKTKKLLKILYQCRKLFNTALRSKHWRYFTKTQRNNIRFWRRQLISIINISCDNDSYLLENDPNSVPKKRRRLERPTEKLVDRENLYLLRQLQNYRHEVISILSECKGELEWRENRNQVLQNDIDGLEQYLKDVRRLQREEEARLRKLGARLKVAHKRLQTKSLVDVRRKEKPIVLPISLSSKEAKLISKITTVLNECPDGATLTTVYGFLHNSDPSLRQRDLLDILNRFPTLFRQEEPASWTNREYRWKIIACNRSV